MGEMVYVVEITSHDVVNRREVSDPAVVFRSLEDARDFCNQEAASMRKKIEWVDEDFIGFAGDDETYTEFSIRHARFV